MQVNDDGGFGVFGVFGLGIIPAAGSGARLMWHPRKATFRAGSVNGNQWDDENVGLQSVAMGANTTAQGDVLVALGVATNATGDASTALGTVTTASGENSTAMGRHTVASGPQSTALGNQTIASGQLSTAMGGGTIASGPASTALGFQTTASGSQATAMGFQTLASGAQSTALGSQTRAEGISSTAMGNNTTALGGYSTAMGHNAVANTGSFVYGDNSTTAVVAAAFANEFVVRASGGMRLRTNPGVSVGCDLLPNSGGWSCTSSRRAKEGFEGVDGEAVLRKLAGISIQRWRYIGTGTPHVGPTAEDFHQAFGLGEGPTTISTVDADGISLLAVQALVKRTAKLREADVRLWEELRQENAELRAELEALRRLLSSGRMPT